MSNIYLKKYIYYILHQYGQIGRSLRYREILEIIQTEAYLEQAIGIEVVRYKRDKNSSNDYRLSPHHKNLEQPSGTIPTYRANPGKRHKRNIHYRNGPRSINNIFSGISKLGYALLGNMLSSTYQPMNSQNMAR